MILVVIAMHAVATNGVETWKPVKIAPHHVEALVLAKIGRICLRYPNDGSVEQMATIDHLHPFKLARRELDQSIVRRRPQLVSLATEILQAEPDRAWIGDEIWTPVVEYL